MQLAKYLRAWTAAVIAVAFSVVCAAAQIATDGSLGPMKSLNGPGFTIGPWLGTLSGNNLFHSFSTFNLAQGESATFTGPSSLANIVARVTGGSSSIDGKITTLTHGSPNLFLVNPAGVVFGPNASLDVEGSFHVSTADYLEFANGAKFMSKLGNGSSFTTAEPAAFGFLNTNPAAVSPAALEINGSVLGVRLGSMISIVGGPLTITADPQTTRPSILRAPSGTIAVTSVASPGKVPLDPASMDTTVQAFGTVSISNGSVLSSTGRPVPAAAGGSVYIRAGDLTIDNSTIAASNLGTGPGGTIALAGERQIKITNGTSVQSIAGLEGNSGSSATIRLTGGDITVSQDSIIATKATGSGRGGDLEVEGGSITLTDGGLIYTATSGPGKAGNVTITADNIGLSDSTIQSQTDTTSEDDIGKSGDITVNADSITLTNSSRINNLTFGSGKGGNVDIEAPRGALEIHTSSAIHAYSWDDSTGDVGNVTVNAGSVTIDDTGEITSNTRGSGHGGSVTVNVAGPLTITGDPKANYITGIVASTEPLKRNAAPKGDAGQITVMADSITLTDAGQIVSLTYGKGDAGNVVVEAKRALEIHGNATAQGESSTGIGVDSVFIDDMGNAAEGNAGSVTVTAGSITIDGGAGLISSTTNGSGTGGSITVDVTGALTITGAPNSTVITGIRALTTLSEDGVHPPAGQITVKADSITITDGFITSATEGSGDGGNVMVKATGALAVHGKRSSSTGITAGSRINPVWQIIPTGKAGAVTVTAGSIMIDGTGQISSSTHGPGNGGDVSVTATTGGLAITGDPTSSIPAGIVTDSLGDDTGNAGNVTVKAGSIKIANTGSISSAASGKGDGGNVSVQETPRLEIHGNAQAVRPTGISTQSNNGRGGNIYIIRSGLLDIAQGLVSATVQNGEENAGNITIDTDLLVLDRSKITADAKGGAGGKLDVRAKGFVETDSEFSAKGTVPGVVDVKALSSDVTSGLVELSGKLVEAASRLACTTAPGGTQNPFLPVIVHGRGDYAFDLDVPQPAFYSSLFMSQDRPLLSRNRPFDLSPIQSGCQR